MLKLALYNRTRSIYEDFFLGNWKNKKVLFVTPGPLEADEIRISISEFPVVSIAQFLRELNCDYKPTRKSVLFQNLGIISKKIDPELKIYEFEEIFKWLTDIRNNVSDVDLQDELYGLFDVKYRKILQFCSRFIDSSEFLDESKFYCKLKETELDFHFDEIIFVGFKYLSSVQLDFLKSFSHNFDITITFPKIVYDLSEHLDWVQWGDFTEIIEIDEISDTLCPVESVAKARLGNKLNNLEFDGLILFKSQLKDEDFQLCGKYLGNVKESFDFLSTEKKWFIAEIKKFTGKEIPLVELRKILDLIKARSIKIKDAKQIKVISSFQKELEETCKLSDSLNIVSDYHLKLIFLVMELNLPRISIVTKDSKYKLKSSRAIEFSNLDNQVGYVDTSFFEGSTEFNTMPVELMKKLAQLGVVKRLKLEESYNQYLISNFMSNHSNVLFYDDVEELDLYFSEFDRHASEEFKNKQDIVYLKIDKIDKKSYFSASRLQSYLDCPRKYYYQYLTKNLKTNIINQEVSSFEKGSFEHLLIRRYFEESICPKYINNFIEDELHKIIKTKEIHDGIKAYLVFESANKILNGIKFVTKLKTNYPEVSIEFEKNINDENFRGSIDLYFTIGEKIGVIDFKRSKGGIPSFADVNKYNSIQVLSYLNRTVRHSGFSGGYVCLENLKDSLIWSDFELNLDIPIKGASYSTLENYKKFENNLIEKIQSDNNFFPSPLKDTKCNYCELRNLCEKQ